MESISPCKEYNHHKRENLYCLNCSFAVCSKCITLHKSHDLCDIDDVFQDITNQSKDFKENILKSIEIDTEKKLIHEEIFKEQIKNQFEEQNQILIDFFRNFHDYLHVKQVELKRELLSYYNENEESYIKSLTLFEEKIIKSKEYLHQLNNISNNSISEIPLDNKIKLIQLFHQLKEKKETIYQQQEQQQQQQEYLKYKVNNYDNIETTIELTKDYSNSNSCFYIYKSFLTQEIERVNTEGKVAKFKVIVQPHTTPSLKLPSVCGDRVFQAVCKNSLMYLTKGKYYGIVIDPYEGSSWFHGDVKGLDEDYSSFSLMYDDNESIYVVGGISEKSNQELKTIYKFNINTFEIERLTVTLPDVSRFHALAFDFKKENLYIIGGFNSIKSAYLNKIERLNIKDRTIHFEVLFDEPILNGCLDYIQDNFYVLTATRPYGFLRYSLKSKITTKLQSPPLVIPEDEAITIFKIYFNGRDSIMFLHNKYSKYLFKYEISKREWSQNRINNEDQNV